MCFRFSFFYFSGGRSVFKFILSSLSLFILGSIYLVFVRLDSLSLTSLLSKTFFSFLVVMTVQNLIQIWFLLKSQMSPLNNVHSIQ